VLLLSALLFIWNLASFSRGPVGAVAPFRFAVAVHPPTRVPAALNGFGLWNVLVLFLMLTAYGWPIAQFFVLKPPQAVVHRVDRGG
jgi:cytochrome c oxidase subunit I